MKILPPESVRRTEFWFNVRAASILLLLGVLASAFLLYHEWYWPFYTQPLSLPVFCILLAATLLLWQAVREGIRRGFALHGEKWALNNTLGFRFSLFLLCAFVVFHVYVVCGTLALYAKPRQEDIALVTAIYTRQLRYGGRVDAEMQLVFFQRRTMAGAQGFWRALAATNRQLLAHCVARKRYRF